jgi:extradiol dioxygenase
MVSFYVRTPSGFDIEYGWGAVTVDDDHTATVMNASSIWGHERDPALEFGALEALADGVTQ